MTTKRIFAQKSIDIDSEEVDIKTNVNAPLTTNGNRVITEADFITAIPPNPTYSTSYDTSQNKIYIDPTADIFDYHIACDVHQDAGQILTAEVDGVPATVVGGVIRIYPIHYTKHGPIFSLSFPTVRVLTCVVAGATQMIYDNFEDPAGKFAVMPQTQIEPLWFELNGGNKSLISYWTITGGIPLQISISTSGKLLNAPYQPFGMNSIILVDIV